MDAKSLDKRLMGSWVLIVPKYYFTDYLLAAKGKQVNSSMERPGCHNLKQSKLTSPLKIQLDGKYFLM